MMIEPLRRNVRLGMGALALAGAFLGVTRYTAAQEQPRVQPPRQQQRPDGFPGPGGPGGPGGGFGGGGGFRGFGGPMMGGSQLTATASHVYVLRGETLYSFDARTLRPMGQVNLPQPQGGPGGPGGPGGAPGGGGFGGGEGGGRQF